MKLDTGRLIAYGGGSGVSATSLAAKAQTASFAITPEPSGLVSLLNVPLVTFGGVQVLMADLVSVGGLAAVFLRLSFDVWRHFDQRRRQGD
ncbi:hypothetical protein [Modicisalibacter luteus]|nr:hypothetical protein [Halomonas lutea]GHB12566.1 hypothetical protein GCM10007159_38400 [Halomonas lutea]